MVAGTLERQRPYTEQEINEALIVWLASVRGTPDHVTLRRRMIDCGFLKRTPNGSRYYLNYGRVVDTLGSGPQEVDAGTVVAGVLREREARKRSHLARSETTSAGG